MRKKVIARKIIALTTALFVAMSSNYFVVSAAQTATVKDSRQTVESYLKSLTPGQKQQILNKYKTGYIKPKITLPKIQTNHKIYKSSNLPSTYDLRTQNKLTSVKNQGTSGSCWSFSSIGSLESCLMPNENRDFSENNLKNNSGFDYDPNGGGNDFMATAYFARWNGPVNETDDPFNETSTSSTSTGPVQKHVQDVIYLPGRTSATDNDAIKNAIMQYGAVSTSMYMDQSNDEDAITGGQTDTYYSSTQYETNHAIDVVGWDDSYSKNNFCDYDNGNSVPAGDGAFIIKNSWGSSWGDNGYFYISYYDVNLAYDMSSVYYKAESTSNYKDIYQYDPLGCVGTFSGSWMANVFTAKPNDGCLSAVSFYAMQPSTSYSIYVCSNYTGTSDFYNNKVLAKTGNVTYSGYYTVNLDNIEPLTAGNKFAVMVEFSSPYGEEIPAEYAESGYSSKATASSGESYISSNGSSWTDATSVNSTANVCLKAFTQKSVTGIEMNSNPTKISYVQGQNIDLTGAYITTTYDDGTTAVIPITSSMISGYSSGTVGTQTITVTYGGKTTSFTVNVAAATIAGVAIKTNPTKTTYMQWQDLDVTGAVITVTYSDGSTADINVTSDMVSGYNSNALGTQTVTVTYGGKTASFNVTVNTNTDFDIQNGVLVKYNGGGGAVTIPSVVTSIGIAAFDSSNITSVTIPNSVTSIGDYAFDSCSKLISITIPSSVTSIGDYVFDFCSTLVNIDVDNDNPNYSSENGVLFNKNKTILIKYPGGISQGSYTIPGSVTNIGDNAFIYTKILNITIPSSVLSIGKDAFYSCNNLASVTIPASVSYIAPRAFNSCRSLTSFTVDPNNTYYSSENNVLFDKNKTELVAYLNNVQNDYMIPSSVTGIGECAFSGNIRLINLTVPNSVNEIGNSAFEYCSSIASIKIPYGVTSIGAAVFQCCSSLSNVTIPNSVTSIGMWAFDSCYSLSKLTIPSSVNSIDHNAFSGTNLTIYCRAGSYAEGFAQTNSIKYKAISSLAMASMPTKSTYVTGQNLDLTGATAKAVYDDGTNETVTLTPDMVSGFNTNTLGSQTLTVSFGGLTTSFNVSVVARALSSISMNSNPAKTTYIQGQNLDLTGAVISENYNDGTSDTVNITSSMVSGYNSGTVGQQTITVTYNGETTSFVVTVIAKALSSISMKTNPITTTYVAGQSLDLMGALISLNYNDGTTETMNVTSSMVSGYNPNLVGTQNIAVTYNGKTACFTVTVIAKAVTSISMKSSPTKTEYVNGQSLDLNGAVVTATYNDGTTQDINVTDSMVSGFDTTKSGQQTVIVTYGGKTASFTVTVVAKAVTSISMKSNPIKTTYVAGQSLDLMGAVISENYNDGTSDTVNITSSMVSGFDTTKSGQQTVTVTYGGKTVSFTVTVIAKAVTSISMKSNPIKTSYVEGQSLDLIGAVVTASYNDGTTQDINITDSMVSGYSPNNIGQQAITVTYGGKTTSFTVNVVAKSVSSISMKSSPTKTEYVQGQNLDLMGAVVSLNYNNDTTETMNVTDSMVSGYNPNTVGQQNITVTYEGKITSFTITVIAKAVTGITLKSNPLTLTYVAGQSLNLTGAVITVSYNDGTTQDINVTSSMVSGFDTTKTGQQIVTVTYGGKSVTFTVTVLSGISVSYQGHVQNIGWQKSVSDGAECGTDGKALRVEAIKLNLNNAPSGLHIEYNAHVQNIGWQGWKSDGAEAGTDGKCLRVEAMQIKLTGTNAQYYSVVYRAHVQNIGWQNWVKDGETAGTTGQSLRVEALEIKIVPKMPSVSYTTHCQNVGWEAPVSNGDLSGTTGKGLRVEALKLNLENAPAGLSIQYRAHVQNIGWQDWTSDGNMAGTTGKALRVEAIQIKLSGTDADKYSVIYQAHVQNIGWQNWVSDGATAGTTGKGLRVEALRVMIIPKQ